MGFTFHGPRFGYDYPATDVKMPCHVVGKLTPSSGDTVLTMGYTIDDTLSADITFPPSLHYGFRLGDGPEGTDGPHELTVNVFNQAAQSFPHVVEFTTNGSASYSAEALAKERAIARIAAAIVDPAAAMVAAPRHTAALLLITLGNPEGGRVKRTLKMRFTAAAGSQSLRVQVVHIFRSADASVREHAVSSVDNPGVVTNVEFTHSDREGTLIHSVLLWDFQDIAGRGGRPRFGSVVASTSFRSWHTPSI